MAEPRCYFCLSADLAPYDDEPPASPSVRRQAGFLEAAYPAIVAFEVLACIGFLVGWLLFADHARFKPVSWVFLSGSVFTAIGLVGQFMQHLSGKNR